MEVEPTVAAYLAGVVDSDGFVTIQRSMRDGVAYYGAKVGITGTRREPHDLAASLFGGTVSRYEPKDPRHRDQFQWSRYGESAIAVLDVIAPHLRIKGRQAEIAYRVHDLVIERPWMYPSRMELAFDELYSDVLALNQSRRHPATP